MKQIIGFATQYYTLWNYEAVNNYRLDAYGNYHKTSVTHNYFYVKNISTDLNKVKSLYPNVCVDDRLKGKTQRTKGKSITVTIKSVEAPHIDMYNEVRQYVVI